MKQYWIITIEEALDEAGFKATEDQIKLVAGICETSHEMYNEYSGNDSIPDPSIDRWEQERNDYNKRISELEKELSISLAADMRRLNASHSLEIDYINGEAYRVR